AGLAPANPALPTAAGLPSVDGSSSVPRGGLRVPRGGSDPCPPLAKSLQGRGIWAVRSRPMQTHAISRVRAGNASGAGAHREASVTVRALRAGPPPAGGDEREAKKSFCLTQAATSATTPRLSLQRAGRSEPREAAPTPGRLGAFLCRQPHLASFDRGKEFG